MTCLIFRLEWVGKNQCWDKWMEWSTDELPDLSGPFTALPNWNFWNKGRKNLSSRSETYEICSKWIRSGGIQKKTQNPKLHPPIPIWDLDARLAGKLPRIEYFCLDCDLVSRLEMKFEISCVGEEEFWWQEFYDFEPCLRTNFGISVNAFFFHEISHIEQLGTLGRKEKANILPLKLEPRKLPLEQLLPGATSSFGFF
ncbi:hypothetical protein AVEN_203488-1 [Araneus ventricosus]|uniref:Uncharacterized protein n=1 Tax=Araneus ventricosus TaxID=182803 RepID=A0A4Y2BJB3_ARAVE|nr:hypothetical protein AVEN_203488-1 [Araneus ventricosus]